MAACQIDGINAAVNCWGGGIVAPMAPAQSEAAINLTERLSCPLLGLFGNDDQNPPPADVDLLEEALKKYGKDYEFHRYDRAGHGFWYYHTEMYRPRQAMDAWQRTFEFFGKHLSSAGTGT
jgi:carboxymethylenebutenolidase